MTPRLPRIAFGLLTIAAVCLALPSAPLSAGMLDKEAPAAEKPAEKPAEPAKEAEPAKDKEPAKGDGLTDAEKAQNAALQKEFTHFPVMDFAGKTEATEVKLNVDPVLFNGLRYSGYRFKANFKPGENFFWVFSCPKDVKFKWFVLPESGPMDGFTGFYKTEVDGTQRFAQGLGGNHFTPGQTYLLWFAFDVAEPIPFKFWYKFTDTPAGADGTYSEAAMLGMFGLK